MTQERRDSCGEGKRMRDAARKHDAGDKGLV